VAQAKERFRRPRQYGRGGAAAVPDTHAAAAPAEYLADLLSETREELNRADSKASLIFAAVGIILGTLVSAAAGAHWSPLRLAQDVQWLWWLGVVAAIYGTLSIAASVRPRFPRAPHAGPPTYFGDVAAYASIEQFRQAVEQVITPLDRLVVQTFVLSRLVQRKYMLLHRGMWALFAAIVACSLAMVVSGLLGH
jgi:MFS family permease